MSMRLVMRGAMRNPAMKFALRAMRTLVYGDATPCRLHGDRAIENAWCIGQLPKAPGRVLDIGCGRSPLGPIAAGMGHAVVGVDLEPIEFVEYPGFEFRQGSILECEFEAARFDGIMACSTVEHIGLADRYGGRAIEDGDLQAMRRCASWLAPGGTMALTIPVGIDAEFPPMHRIYGAGRLPRLLAGFAIEQAEFWTRPADGERALGPWRRSSREDALAVKGDGGFYGLGLFALKRG